MNLNYYKNVVINNLNYDEVALQELKFLARIIIKKY